MKHPNLVSRLTLEEKCALLSGRDFWRTVAVERLGIESVTLSDGPHGVRRQEIAGAQMAVDRSLPATCYPTASTMANAWDEDLNETLGAMLGEEAVSQEVGVLLGPGLNLQRNPLCGRNFEYFSEDPYLSGKLAAACVRGIQSQGVAACLKHFAANNTETRRMASNSVIDERTLRELYLTGFEIAVKEGGAKTVMAAYNELNGVYCNENAHLLTDILRKEWGFEGFVMSDWGANNDFVEGVRAGSNLEMPSTCGDGPRQLMEALKAGTITEAEVDARVDELLGVLLPVQEVLKARRGIPFDAEAHHRFALRCAEESIVLLKNEGGLLPLSPGARVALLGPFVQEPRIQGAGSSLVKCTKLDTVPELISEYDLKVEGVEPGCPRHGAFDRDMRGRAVTLAKRADAALLFLGLGEAEESEGVDRSNMAIPEGQIALLKAVARVNKNVIVILSGGAPVEAPWIDDCQALVFAGLGGQAGAGAVLRVLTGAANPCGKLAATWPLRYGDCPSARYYPAWERCAEYREGLFAGYRYYNTAHVPVQFPFGFGLSYTVFQYSDIRLKDRKVCFTLTNAGDRDGAEVAQLYIHAEAPAIHRPNRELKGFVRVCLRAGESREVCIPLDDKAFRYFNRVTNRFERDGGWYELQVGASVEDIRLALRVRIRGTGAPAPEDREALAPYYAGDVTNVSDAAFEALLGHPIPDGHWSDTIGLNDAVSQLCYARSPVARMACRWLNRKIARAARQGRPDTNLLFAYNMSFRAICKLSRGRLSPRTLQHLLNLVIAGSARRQ